MPVGTRATTRALKFQCSSASRKFLNRNCSTTTRAIARFQCSSASRKFLNRSWLTAAAGGDDCFSALQRAENSSIEAGSEAARVGSEFQCSSASRKFLNCTAPEAGQTADAANGFSALQRAENSSIPTRVPQRPPYSRVSVLFSEPKIPQYTASPRV